jgi:hypothetical protein
VAVGAASLGYLDQAHQALHLAGVIYGVGPVAIVAGDFQGVLVNLDPALGFFLLAIGFCSGFC